MGFQLIKRTHIGPLDIPSILGMYSGRNLAWVRNLAWGTTLPTEKLHATYPGVS